MYYWVTVLLLWEILAKNISNFEFVFLSIHLGNHHFPLRASPNFLSQNRWPIPPPKLTAVKAAEGQLRQNGLGTSADCPAEKKKQQQQIKTEKHPMNPQENVHQRKRPAVESRAE